eukprot:COSAG02_NODE_78_length_40609_cov_19.893730_14_plen_391_part_00
MRTPCVRAAGGNERRRIRLGARRAVRTERSGRRMVRRTTVRRLAICGSAALCAACVVLGATLSFEQRHSVVQFLDLHGITAGQIGGFRSQWGQVRPLPPRPPGLPIPLYCPLRPPKPCVLVSHGRTGGWRRGWATSAPVASTWSSAPTTATPAPTPPGSTMSPASPASASSPSTKTSSGCSSTGRAARMFSPAWGTSAPGRSGRWLPFGHRTRASRAGWTPTSPSCSGCAAPLLACAAAACGALSLSGAGTQDRERGSTSVRSQVPCKTLGSILATAGVSHVDYLSVDTEGSELEVLASLDWARTPPTIVQVEVMRQFHNARLDPDPSSSTEAELRQFMDGHGYEVERVFTAPWRPASIGSMKKAHDLMFVKVDGVPDVGRGLDEEGQGG